MTLPFLPRLKGHSSIVCVFIYSLRLLIQFSHNIYDNNNIKHIYFGAGMGYTIYTIGVRDGECESSKFNGFP